MRLPNLKDLIGSDWKNQTLTQILGNILPGGGSVRTRAERYLRDRLKSQQARSSGAALAGATMKLVEDAMNPATGLPVTTRAEVGQALAQNAAVQFHAAGEALLNLAVAQTVLEEARGHDHEDAARMAREAAEDAFERACINIGRAAAGDRVQ